MAVLTVQSSVLTTQIDVHQKFMPLGGCYAMWWKLRNLRDLVPCQAAMVDRMDWAGMLQDASSRPSQLTSFWFTEEYTFDLSSILENSQQLQ